tara:strand:+ start:413 stop:682 length:270 start_codon:yes stop_codon:yes gene_type:complete
MKKKYKLGIVFINIILLIVAIQFNINLLLNKKFVVDEISHTFTKEGLKGIEEIVSNDYIWMFYFTIFNTLLLIILSIILLRFKSNSSIQ